VRISHDVQHTKGFRGTTTFLLAGMTSSTDRHAVTTAINRFPGVRVVLADQVAGLVTVNADRPVNRADLTAAITQAGCTVLP
jgi:copper chaperone CopZ